MSTTKQLIEQLAMEHGKPKKSVMRPNGMGQQMLLDGYDFTASELEAMCKAYQSAAPIDNELLQEVICILHSHIGSTSKTPLSDAIAQVKTIIPSTQAPKPKD